MDNQLWRFTDHCGSFTFPEPEKFNALYFPLANESEFMSSITPLGKGDIKTGLNAFLMQPVTRDDLHNLRSGRNFWIYSQDGQIWSACGMSAFTRPEQVSLDAGLLWHRVTRDCPQMGLRAVITNFVPASGEHVELMQFTITNTTEQALTITPTAAIPIFGRSADNLRDHRHVTSLLHRIRMQKEGICVTPVMSFDERGHEPNQITYAIMGCEDDATLPTGMFPTVESFIGEAGHLEAPQAIINNWLPPPKLLPEHQGKEAIGALRFRTRTLMPGESATYILMAIIAEKPVQVLKIYHTFNSGAKFETALHATARFWQDKSDIIRVTTGNTAYDNWFRWVSIQPLLRKIYGCSFLPDFDYGRGGKGWRDLWQDCLALLLSAPETIRDTLVANFGGVRIDGTNATIITRQPGEFIADRNKISRVWMDHGVWPFFTLMLYIHQTGDFSVLFEKVPYFYDRQLSRGQEIDYEWNPQYKHCKNLHTKDGHIYTGTVLEHILVQHLTAFFNVGAHNSIKLEDADWNDGLDMAAERGESVAFTCFYAGNIVTIVELLTQLKQHNHSKISLAKELLILLDKLQKKPIDYTNPEAKTALLGRYFKAVKRRLSGKKVMVPVDGLIKDLTRKWESMFSHIGKNEWMQLTAKTGLFNGYYDNAAKRVEGKNQHTVRMTLTGQVFPIMSGIADEEQVRQAFRSACTYLRDPHTNGFRLNNNFGEPQFNLGRAFSFSYGDKENGAVFSHMCVMFANALYRRGFAQEGHQVFHSLFALASDTPVSKIYPCLPEYFNSQGRGLYCYLTGSASWYILTALNEMFGVRGEYGDLLIEPKLTKEQFADSSIISVDCLFAGIRLNLSFHNPLKCQQGDYTIKKVTMQPAALSYTQPHPGALRITRKDLLAGKTKNLSIEIELG